MDNFYSNPNPVDIPTYDTMCMFGRKRDAKGDPKLQDDKVAPNSNDRRRDSGQSDDKRRSSGQSNDKRRSSDNSAGDKRWSIDKPGDKRRSSGTSGDKRRSSDKPVEDESEEPCKPRDQFCEPDETVDYCLPPLGPRPKKDIYCPDLDATPDPSEHDCTRCFADPYFKSQYRDPYYPDEKPSHKSKPTKQVENKPKSKPPPPKSKPAPPPPPPRRQEEKKECQERHDLTAKIDYMQGNHFNLPEINENLQETRKLLFGDLIQFCPKPPEKCNCAEEWTKKWEEQAKPYLNCDCGMGKCGCLVCKCGCGCCDEDEAEDCDEESKTETSKNGKGGGGGGKGKEKPKFTLKTVKEKPIYEDDLMNNNSKDIIAYYVPQIDLDALNNNVTPEAEASSKPEEEKGEKSILQELLSNPLSSLEVKKETVQISIARPDRMRRPFYKESESRHKSRRPSQDNAEAMPTSRRSSDVKRSQSPRDCFGERRNPCCIPVRCCSPKRKRSPKSPREKSQSPEPSSQEPIKSCLKKCQEECQCPSPCEDPPELTCQDSAEECKKPCRIPYCCQPRPTDSSCACGKCLESDSDDCCGCDCDCDCDCDDNFPSEFLWFMLTMNSSANYYKCDASYKAAYYRAQLEQERALACRRLQVEACEQSKKVAHLDAQCLQQIITSQGVGCLANKEVAITLRPYNANCTTGKNPLIDLKSLRLFANGEKEAECCCVQEISEDECCCGSKKKKSNKNQKSQPKSNAKIEPKKGQSQSKKEESKSKVEPKRRESIKQETDCEDEEGGECCPNPKPTPPPCSCDENNKALAQADKMLPRCTLGGTGQLGQCPPMAPCPPPCPQMGCPPYCAPTYPYCPTPTVPYCPSPYYPPSCYPSPMGCYPGYCMPPPPAPMPCYYPYPPNQDQNQCRPASSSSQDEEEGGSDEDKEDNKKESRENIPQFVFINYPPGCVPCPYPCMPPCPPKKRRNKSDTGCGNDLERRDVGTFTPEAGSPRPSIGKYESPKHSRSHRRRHSPKVKEAIMINPHPFGVRRDRECCESRRVKYIPCQVPKRCQKSRRYYDENPEDDCYYYVNN